MKAPDTMTIKGKTFTLHTNEDGSITLKPLEDKEEPRKPQPWDVYAGKDHVSIADSDASWFVWAHFSGSWVGTGSVGEGAKHVGNLMDLVKGEYVRKDDVIAALSHEDGDGECVLDLMGCSEVYGASESRKALAALGIVKEGGE